MPYETIDSILRELLERHRREKDQPTAFKEKMLAMGSEGGRFVTSIVRAFKPKRGLEIGTSSGFSALCAFKGALEASGSTSDIAFHLTTVDYDPAKAEWALKNFKQAGIEHHVTIIIDDAQKACNLIEGEFDYLLLDAEKSTTLGIFKVLYPKLAPGAVILTDNMQTHADELSAFSQYVRSHPGLASAMFPIGNGVEFTLKLSERLTDNIIPGDDLRLVSKG